MQLSDTLALGYIQRIYTRFNSQNINNRAAEVLGLATTFAAILKLATLSPTLSYVDDASALMIKSQQTQQFGQSLTLSRACLSPAMNLRLEIKRATCLPPSPQLEGAAGQR